MHCSRRVRLITERLHRKLRVEPGLSGRVARNNRPLGDVGSRERATPPLTEPLPIIAGINRRRFGGSAAGQ
jgi:hypothetical protein